MNIISIDLEMNQPSGKIIQLGYVIANVKTGKALVTKQLNIDPNEPLEERIKLLTGLTDEDLSKGTSLADAYCEMTGDIHNYSASKRPFQWGTDHFYLIEQLDILWESYVFDRKAYDIKAFYELAQMTKSGSKLRRGLENALNSLGVSWDYTYGPPHRALADAYNTFKLHQILSRRVGLFDTIKKAINEEE